MLNTILTFGAIAGALAGLPLFILTVTLAGPPPMPWRMILGYATMLIALSIVFLAVKRHRDQTLGGVIRFWPAFGMGLAVSLIAGIFYVIAWEAALAVTRLDFAGEYTRTLVEQARSRGATAKELTRMTAELEAFARQYANPLFRVAITLSEILPVGVLVSLVSAALLRNPRFMAPNRG